MILTDELAQATAWASVALPHRASNPMDMGIRLSSPTKAGLVVSVRSDAMQAEVLISPDQVEGEWIVSGGLFAEVAKALPRGQQVRLFPEGDRLAIHCGSIRVSQPLLPPASPIAWVPPAGAMQCEVSGAAMAAAIKQVAPAAGLPEAVYIEPDLNALHLTTTDHARIARTRISVRWEGEMAEAAMLVPIKPLVDLARVMPADDPFVVSLGKDFAMRSWSHAVSIRALTQQGFPNCEPSLQRSPVATVTLAGSALAKVVRSVAQKEPVIYLKGEGGELTLRSAWAEEPAEVIFYDGEPFEFSCDPKFLLAGLRAAGSCEVALEYAHPGVLTLRTGFFRYVLAPRREVA